jgi:hypothetical protein
LSDILEGISHLKKPIGKSNVAIAEVYLSDGLGLCAGATSKDCSLVKVVMIRLM